MKRLVAAALGLLVAAGSVSAQFPGPTQYVRPPTNPYGQPVVSPFLNLARPGSPAINYFNLVRPQQEVQTSLQLLQTGVSQLPAAVIGEVATTLPVTGHSTRFMGHTRYFFHFGGQTTPAVSRPAVSPPAVIPQAVTPRSR